MNTSESPCELQELRRHIAGIQHARPQEKEGCVSLGVEAIDRSLGGGLARGKLHELFALEKEEEASAAGFAAMLAVRFGGPVVWLRTERAHAEGGGLYAPGLLDIGFDPTRLLVAVLPDANAVLRAANDIARCREVGIAIVELWRRCPELGLTETRRLTLAAEGSGSTVLMLRVDAEPVPSAAQTRWSVQSAEAVPLDANAPGRPTLNLELLRQRGRPAGGSWRVEWDRDQANFVEPATSAPLRGPVVPLPSYGSDQARPGLRRAG
ncbi:ImuA family protein [Sphingomonas tabacisoli]|uniref:ImuA family protein n=1 Tax=Sphingomonas tabacisoli TaxID=2249466 RepID=A0ABW4I4A4_9SPHN